ncbi:uncharacterized protein LOC141906248 [Tubulanus polymorphus]|uniref:uncharacterized protein LOC141906248 n=1 Tax=Tubulanus polymorphus TaxID=672921 RepID=UPI003DA2DD3D
MEDTVNTFLRAAEMMEKRRTVANTSKASSRSSSQSKKTASSQLLRLETAAKAARATAELSAIENIERESEAGSVVLDNNNELLSEVKVEDWLKSNKGIDSDLSPGAQPFVPVLPLENDVHIKDPPELTDTQAIVRHLNKPTSQLKRFDGDPLEYNRFVRQFKHKIIANSDDKDECMNYLEQYTGGEAHKAIVGYGQLDSSVGFPSAMKELEIRYGDKEIIASAYVKKALEWPIVKQDNPKLLDELGMFLMECQNAIIDLKGVKLLEYPDNIKRIVNKLSYGLQERWRNVVCNLKEKGRSVAFDDLVTFIRKESRKACDPIYGRTALSSVDPKASKSNKSKQTFVAAATTITSTSNQYSTSRCVFCNKEGHFLDNCFELKRKPLDDRIDYFRKNWLCFGCAKSGHRANECKARSTCKEKDCGKRHPTVIHRSPNSKSGVTTETETVTTKTEKAVTGATLVNQLRQSLDAKAKMTVVPVRLRAQNGLKEIVTYAFMDNGSEVSFIRKSLVDEICNRTKPVTLKLGTVSQPQGSDLKTEKAFGLEIRASDEENFEVVQLPPLYAIEEIPVTAGHIVNQDDIGQWPHLSEIYMPDHSGITLGLLLGGNVPDAYSPRDFVSGPSGSPHATKTRLEDQKLETLERQIKETYNQDFPERVIDDEKQWSVEDKMFIDRKSNLRKVDGHYEIPLPLRSDVKLPNNKSVAESRLKSLKKKLVNDDKLRKDYVTFMNGVIESGFAEIFPSDEVEKTDKQLKWGFAKRRLTSGPRFNEQPFRGAVTFP